MTTEPDILKHISERYKVHLYEVGESISQAMELCEIFDAKELNVTLLDVNKFLLLHNFNNDSFIAYINRVIFEYSMIDISYPYESFNEFKNMFSENINNGLLEHDLEKEHFEYLLMILGDDRFLLRLYNNIHAIYDLFKGNVIFLGWVKGLVDTVAYINV